MNVTRAGIDGCCAFDTASNIGKKGLGPVLMDVVLPIPPARFVNVDEAGAGIDGCYAPDTASEFY